MLIDSPEYVPGPRAEAPTEKTPSLSVKEAHLLVLNLQPKEQTSNLIPIQVPTELLSKDAG